MIEAFGTFAAGGMVLCYALETRGRAWVFGLAGFCALSSVYAFWIESWPFFAVEGVWSGLALRRGFARECSTRQMTRAVPFETDPL